MLTAGRTSIQWPTLGASGSGLAVRLTGTFAGCWDDVEGVLLSDRDPRTFIRESEIQEVEVVVRQWL